LYVFTPQAAANPCPWRIATKRKGK
jgi:hypothetical protein